MLSNVHRFSVTAIYFFLTFFKQITLYTHLFSKKISISVPNIVDGVMAQKNCPIDAYCLNGGTCQFFPSIGELSCL